MRSAAPGFDVTEEVVYTTVGTEVGRHVLVIGLSEWHRTSPDDGGTIPRVRSLPSSVVVRADKGVQIVPLNGEEGYGVASDGRWHFGTSPSSALDVRVVITLDIDRILRGNRQTAGDVRAGHVPTPVKSLPLTIFTARRKNNGGFSLAALVLAASIMGHILSVVE